MPDHRRFHPGSLAGCLALVAGLAVCHAPGTAPRPVQLPDSLQGLPLVELPTGKDAPVLALVMSGDGNWASFVRELADTLVERGVPVVGLESRSYLSQVRTPEELARDMEAVLRHYLKGWSAEEILVVGYSRGADFAPFLVNRLPQDLRSRVRGVAILSPTKMASFEFHLIDLVHYVRRPSDIPAVPEVEALAPLPVLCVYGVRDQDALCPLLPEGTADVVPLDAGHRLHGSGILADLLLARFSRIGVPGTNRALE
jgi:type IV secretory pathway VirJ component